MSKQTQRAAGDDDAADFTPVSLRIRHDGWTPARQVAFIKALATSACVEDACRAVGMSVKAAYALRRRPNAASFRQAWELAVDFAVSRLADAAFGRALNGVAVPIFYKGEQVGERRVFNEGLTKFMLRYHRPDRYGAWLDDTSAKERHPDGSALRMTEAIRRLAEDGTADRAGRPRPARAPMRVMLMMDDPAEQEAAEARDTKRREDDFRRYLDTLSESADDPK